MTGPPLDAAAEAWRALEAAQTYGYDPAAAYAAVLDLVADLDATQARQTLAALAAFISGWAVHISHAPGGQRTVPLDMWVEYHRCLAAAEPSEPPR